MTLCLELSKKMMRRSCDRRVSGTAPQSSKTAKMISINADRWTDVNRRHRHTKCEKKTKKSQVDVKVGREKKGAAAAGFCPSRHATVPDSAVPASSSPVVLTDKFHKLTTSNWIDYFLIDGNQMLRRPALQCKLMKFNSN